MPDGRVHLILAGTDPTAATGPSEPGGAP
jgi:hypothetical protein